MRSTPENKSRTVLWIVALAAVILGVSADSNAIEGPVFRELCESYKSMSADPQGASKNDLLKAGMFKGFVWAILESWTDSEARKGLFCIPIGVSDEQAARIVADYMDNHPEYWHLPAMMQVAMALEEKFPCPRESDEDQE